MKWINVDDRLPDDDKDVLTYSDDKYYPFWISYYCHQSNTWLSTDDHLKVNVSHWMELTPPNA
jgi:Protein of unknown function (DUF551)